MWERFKAESGWQILIHFQNFYKDLLIINQYIKGRCLLLFSPFDSLLIATQHSFASTLSFSALSLCQPIPLLLPCTLPLQFHVREDTLLLFLSMFLVPSSKALPKFWFFFSFSFRFVLCRRCIPGARRWKTGKGVRCWWEGMANKTNSSPSECVSSLSMTMPLASKCWRPCYFDADTTVFFPPFFVFKIYSLFFFVP